MKWSFITAGCSFMRVLPQEFSTSSVWFFIIVVFMRVVFHQCGLHQGCLSSGWSSSGLSFIRVVFIRVVFHQMIFIRVVFHQGVGYSTVQTPRSEGCGQFCTLDLVTPVTWLIKSWPLRGEHTGGKWQLLCFKLSQVKQYFIPPVKNMCNCATPSNQDKECKIIAVSRSTQEM